MVVFNPIVPDTQDPNFLGYSKPISDIKADTSNGMDLSLTGDALKLGVEFTDDAIKKDIENKAYAAIDPARDAMTANLEAQKASLVRPSGEPLSLTSTEPQNIPAGVQNGLDRIGKLYQAKGQTAIPTNDTLYSAQALAVAKGLRAEYPGYREYIDQKVSQASGLPVANAYYKNLIQDINHAQAKVNSEQTKAESMITKNMQYPGAKEMWAKFQTGQASSTDVFNWAADAQAKDYADQQRRAAMADRKAAIGDDQTVASADYGLSVSDMIDTRLKTLTINTPWGTSEKLGKLMEDVYSGKVKINPDDAVNMGPVIAGYRQSLYNAGLEIATKRDPRYGNISYAARAGGLENLKKELDTRLSVFDDFYKFTAGAQFSLADLAKKRTEAMTSTTRMAMYDDPGFGKGYMAMKVAAEDFGNNFAGVFATTMIQNDMSEKLKPYFSGVAFKALTGNKNQPGNPAPSSMNEEADKAQVLGLGRNEDGTANKDGVEFTKSLMKIPQTIGNPEAPLDAKLKLAQWAFNPKNLPFLRKFNMDYVDPTTGQWVEGKYGAYNRLTSAGIAEGMKEVRDKGGMEGQQAYKNWVMWSQLSLQEVIGQDLASFSKIPTEVEGKKLRVDYFTGDGTRPPEFRLMDAQGRPFPTRSSDPTTQGYLNNLHQTVSRINIGIQGAARVAATDGTNTASQVLRMIVNAGYTPGPTTTGLPAYMMNAIKSAAQDKAKAINDRNKAIQKRAEEDSTGIRGALQTIRDMPPIPDESGGQVRSLMDSSFSPQEIERSKRNK